MAPKKQKKAEVNVVGIFATIGVILVALGIIWMFVSNWDSFSTSIKIIVLLGATGLSFLAAYKLDEKSYGKTAQSVYLLTCLLWTLSVFIIAQQFNYGMSMQDNANLALVSTIGMAIVTYTMSSKPSLVLSTVAFFAWSMLQVASLKPSGFIEPDAAVIYASLAVAILYFTLGRLRLGNKDGYSDVYANASIVVALVTVYISQTTAWIALLGGQYHIDSIRPLGIALLLSAAGLSYRSSRMTATASKFTWAAAVTLLYTAFTYTHQYAQAFIKEPIMRLFTINGLVFALLPIVCMAYAISQVNKTKNITKSDIYSGIALYAIYLISVIAIPLILGTQAITSPKEAGTSIAEGLVEDVSGMATTPIWSMPYAYITQWLIFNAMYIALVLYVINFASREDRQGLLTTALLFFGAYIIVRYVGFMTDLSGYLALSSLLIIGGLGLIALSIGYHKLWQAKKVAA